MKTWKEYKKELLKNKTTEREYNKLSPCYLVVSQIIEARIRKGITQKDLARKVGTKQSAIARLEAGKCNPTILFLERVASALDTRLTIEFK